MSVASIRGSAEIGIMLAVAVLVIAMASLFPIVSAFSHEKNSISMTQQFMALSNALRDYYKSQCPGSVPQPTWVDLQAIGLNMNDVEAVRPLIVSMVVTDQESPFVTININSNSLDMKKTVVNLNPGEMIGNVYSWTVRLNPYKSDPGYGYRRLYSKRCGL